MLTNLKLLHFRNYDRCDWNLEPGLNLLVGSNGHGKTNLLEAVYYLALLRSFRTNQISNLKQWQRDGFYLEGNCRQKDGSILKLTVSYVTERKTKCKWIPFIKPVNSYPFYCSTFISGRIWKSSRGGGFERRRFWILLEQLSGTYFVICSSISTLFADEMSC